MPPTRPPAAPFEDDHSGVPQRPLIRHRLAARLAAFRPGIPVIRAKSYHPGGNNDVTRLVIHTAECPVRRGMARAVANYFAGGSGGRAASAHYCVDPGEVIQCVDEGDEAYHAPPNAGSIGIEPAGTASGTDWTTADALAELGRVADLGADICRRHNLPAVFCSAADLRAGKRGITTHHQVTLAWNQSSHTDPDPSLPMPGLVAMIAQRLGEGPTPQPSEEDDMMMMYRRPDGSIWRTDGIVRSRVAPGPAGWFERGIGKSRAWLNPGENNSIAQDDVHNSLVDVTPKV